MKKLVLTACAGLVALMAPIAATAQTASSAAVRTKTAIADIKAAIDNSKAWRDANSRRSQTFASQIQDADARRVALDQKLRNMIDAANAAANAAKKPPSQEELARIRTVQDQGNQEIATILAPVSRSDAYVISQINARINDVVRAAMRRNGVGLLITNLEGVVNDGGLDLTADITRELDSVLPNVSIDPPAGWTPPGAAAPAGK